MGGDLADRVMGECIIRVVGGWQFDSVMGGFMTAGEGKWEKSDREMGGGTVREGGAV